MFECRIKREWKVERNMSQKVGRKMSRKMSRNFNYEGNLRIWTHEAMLKIICALDYLTIIYKTRGGLPDGNVLVRVNARFITLVDIHCGMKLNILLL